MVLKYLADLVMQDVAAAAAGGAKESEPTSPVLSGCAPGGSGFGTEWYMDSPAQWREGHGNAMRRVKRDV